MSDETMSVIVIRDNPCGKCAYYDNIAVCPRHHKTKYATCKNYMPIFNECGWVASKCRHIKPRTIEDVLRDLVDGIDSVEFDALTAIGEAAEEIRKLMEVDR